MFSVIVLALLWIFQIVFLNDIYKAVKLSNINTVIKELSPNINSGDIKKYVTQYAVKYDTCISVWDSNLKQVASTCINSNCRVHTYSLVGAAEFMLKAKANGGQYTEHYGGIRTPVPNDKEFWNKVEFEHIDNENESIMFANIITGNDGKEYLLLMNAVITPIRSVVQSLRMIFLFIAIIMILLSIIISSVISKYMLRPINKINATAALLAKGNYDVHFDENSYTEISELASTLNYAASELSSVESTRNELIANVSHDLRTPLTLISGYAEMMMDFPNDNNSENLKTIVDEVNHMTLLVNDLTDVSKYNAGVQKLSITKFDITSLIKDTSERLTRLNNPTGCKINFEYTNTVFILADEIKITQVIYNLVNNAVIHTGEDKTVIIKQIITEVNKNKFVEIQITDSGKGIPEENVKSIWDRYFKVDKTYKRAHNGSGLGLSIVKSILELHKMEYGVIPVEKMPNKTGCTFWFRSKITE